jgi:hypothetical protein
MTRPFTKIASRFGLALLLLIVAVAAHAEEPHYDCEGMPDCEDDDQPPTRRTKARAQPQGPRQDKSPHCTRLEKQMADLMREEGILGRQLREMPRDCRPAEISLRKKEVIALERTLALRKQAARCYSRKTASDPWSPSYVQGRIGESRRMLDICLQDKRTPASQNASVASLVDQQLPRSASCSDITGTGGPPAPNENDCKEAKNAERLAQQAAKVGDRDKAAKEYERAADAYLRAGDGNKHFEMFASHQFVTMGLISRDAAAPPAEARAPSGSVSPPPASPPVIGALAAATGQSACARTCGDFSRQCKARLPARDEDSPTPDATRERHMAACDRDRARCENVCRGEADASARQSGGSSSECLKMSRPELVGGLQTYCGHGLEENWVVVENSDAAHCPRSTLFTYGEYKRPGVKGPYEAPIIVQTCGWPPERLRAVEARSFPPRDPLPRERTVTAPPPAASTAMRKSASCSDITGTGGPPAPNETDCKNAARSLQAARDARAKRPDIAAKEYKKAAEAYRRAGDTAREAAMLREVESLAALAATPPSTPSAEPPSAPSSAPSSPPGLAVAPPAAAPTTSGASQPPSPPPAEPASRGKLWLPTEDNANCEQANASERRTAAWYNTCVPRAPRRSVNGYRHPLSPQELFRRARAKCGSASRETAPCYIEAKLAILLEADPAIGAACQTASAKPSNALREQLSRALDAATGTDRSEQLKREAFIACVHQLYLYGEPAGDESLREQMKKRQEEAEREEEKKEKAAAGAAASAEDSLRGGGYCPPGKHPRPGQPSTCCPPGHGMKPTPGAFGASSCQKLGLDANRTSVHPAVASESEEAFERHVNDVAMDAAVAAAAAEGGRMLALIKRDCAMASFHAARAVIKGGAPEVPEACRPMAAAARAQLSRYATAHIDAGNAGLSEALAYLSARADLGTPQPGLTGIAPDEQMSRQSDCIIRGGTAEACAAASGPPPASAGPDCARAETHWKNAEEIKKREAYQDHLARFPACEFATLARARLESLGK